MAHKVVDSATINQLCDEVNAWEKAGCPGRIALKPKGRRRNPPRGFYLPIPEGATEIKVALSPKGSLVISFHRR